MSLALARSLLLSDALTRSGLARALRAHVEKGASLVRALIIDGGADPELIETLLSQWDGPVLSEVSPAEELTHKLAPQMMERLLAIPVRRDPRTGTVEVAVVDPNDPHALA